jgi:hypothetical protein
MKAPGQPGYGYTAMLRRLPARIVEGRPECGYTSMVEVIGCTRGDHLYLDYSQVSPRPQRIRSPTR